MAPGSHLGFFVLVLSLAYASSYVIPSENLEAEAEVDDRVNPTYFTYKAKIVLGNSVQFNVAGSTADGDRDLVLEPAEDQIRFARQQVTKTSEGGKPVITLTINSTVLTPKKKIKYIGFTTITFRAREKVQWYSDHEAKQVLNYKGKGCDPADLQCQGPTTPAPRKDPCVRVVRGEVATSPRPQYNFNRESSGNGASVVCQSQEVSPGSFRYSCNGVDPSLITISTEHILWLNGPNGCDEQVDVIIPNYRVEELIRAAIKASSAGSTNINLLLKKPERIYDVQAQDGVAVPAPAPVVNLQYEDVPKPVSLHYPTDQQYNPLSGPIREPGQGNY